MDLRRERRKNSHILGVLIIAGSICIALITMLSMSVYIKNSRKTLFDRLDGLDPTAKSAGDIFSLMLGENGEDTISYEIKEEIVFKNSGAQAFIMLKSSEKNRYPIKMTLLVEDESVLKTGYILPGYMIETAKLDKKLKAGEYDAVALIEAFSPEDESVIGQLKQEVRITILE